MTQPVAFSPFLGWIDVNDPNNIPPGTQKINAANLIRLEKGIRDVVERANAHTLVVDAVAVAAGANWTLRVFPCATEARPSAVTLGAGATIFDTTLKKPLWSDGAIWVDATGVEA